MMHGNLEFSRIRKPRILSASLDAVSMTLVGSYVISDEGPTMNFLDPGGAAKDVYLPPIRPSAGQFIVIANMGSFELNVLDDGGVPVVDVLSGVMGFLTSHPQGWTYMLHSAPSAIQNETTVTLIDEPNVALDASEGSMFVLEAAGDRTILAPSNAPDPGFGQKMIIRHTAVGGPRLLTLETGVAGGFRFGTDFTVLTTTASGLTDYVGALWNETADRWDVVSYIRGF